MDTSALITINNLVKETIWKAQTDIGERELFYQYCIDVYRHLRINFVKQGRVSKKFSVDQDLFTVDYTDDVIKVIDVGVSIDGEIWWLSRKNKIVTTTTQSGGLETFGDGEGEDLNNGFMSGYSAVGNINNEGYYIDDPDNRRIMLRNFTGTEVWLYYITSGVSLSGTSYIPVLYKETIQLGILMNKHKFDSNGNPNLYAKYKQEYEESLRYLRRAERASLEDIWNALLESTNPLAKR